VPADPAVETSRLHKSYGDVQALHGVDLRVETRILTTLLQPDEGSARVAGFDVLRDAAKVRRHIGLAGQYAAAGTHELKAPLKKQHLRWDAPLQGVRLDKAFSPLRATPAVCELESLAYRLGSGDDPGSKRRVGQNHVVAVGM
jgi:ABC-type Na+ transport system ATPase subunit NatA